MKIETLYKVAVPAKPEHELKDSCERFIGGGRPLVTLVAFIKTPVESSKLQQNFAIIVLFSQISLKPMYEANQVQTFSKCTNMYNFD